jgi:hypothetical protein
MEDFLTRVCGRDVPEESIERTEEDEDDSYEICNCPCSSDQSALPTLLSETELTL